jgi:glycosyltransferase involved in cell wall biosynthesis
VYPPVDIERFYNRPAEDYYLIVSELVSYKRIDDAVRVFSQTNRRLKIVGDGPSFKLLKQLAGPQIEFCGRVTMSELAELYARCRALVLPGEEDFGIVAVEAIASGKPVIALGRGGVLESVPFEHPKAGFFYSQPGEEALRAAVERFESEESTISPLALRLVADRFSTARFEEQIVTMLGLHERLPAPARSLQEAVS